MARVAYMVDVLYIIINRPPTSLQEYTITRHINTRPAPRALRQGRLPS